MQISPPLRLFEQTILSFMGGAHIVIPAADTYISTAGRDTKMVPDIKYRADFFQFVSATYGPGV